MPKNNVRKIGDLVDSSLNKTGTFDSKSSKLTHSGYLSRASAIDGSNVVYAYIRQRCKELNIKLSYDLSYNGFPGDLVITEAFGGHGGVVLHPADFKFSQALVNASGSGDRDTTFLLKKKDKYALFELPANPDKLVILPGTNMLGDISDKTLLSLAKKGCMFKPHPITTEYFIRKISVLVGLDRVYNKMASGALLVERCNELHVTRSTELGLYARLSGKSVKVYKTETSRRGSYHYLYNATNPIGNVLSTPKSGVIFQGDDYKDQVDEFLAFYREQLAVYATKQKKKKR